MLSCILIPKSTGKPNHTWGQGRVECLCEEDELELDPLLELDRDGVGLLEEDGVAPEVVPERGELVLPPLGEAVRRKLVLALRPVALGLEYGVYCTETE